MECPHCKQQVLTEQEESDLRWGQIDRKSREDMGKFLLVFVLPCAIGFLIAFLIFK
jgi:hypothetical protein